MNQLNGSQIRNQTDSKECLNQLKDSQIKNQIDNNECMNQLNGSQIRNQTDSKECMNQLKDSQIKSQIDNNECMNQLNGSQIKNQIDNDDDKWNMLSNEERIQKIWQDIHPGLHCLARQGGVLFQNSQSCFNAFQGLAYYIQSVIRVAECVCSPPPLSPVSSPRLCLSSVMYNSNLRVQLQKLYLSRASKPVSGLLGIPQCENNCNVKGELLLCGEPSCQRQWHQECSDRLKDNLSLRKKEMEGKEGKEQFPQEQQQQQEQQEQEQEQERDLQEKEKEKEEQDQKEQQQLQRGKKLIQVEQKRKEIKKLEYNSPWLCPLCADCFEMNFQESQQKQQPEQKQQKQQELQEHKHHDNHQQQLKQPQPQQYIFTEKKCFD